MKRPRPPARLFFSLGCAISVGMSLTIRPATIQDVEPVDGLLSSSYPKQLKRDYAPSTMVTALPLISRAQPALVTCGTYFVLEQGGALCAAGGWTRGAPKGSAYLPLRGHVRHVVTDYRHTRRGHGRALMEHIFRSARTTGIETLEVLSTLTAEPFYRALGFKGAEAVTVPIGPANLPFQSVRMLRDL
ncbi:MAG: GNAT family N-acetyltransferase [Pseudomonadota bacterium]